MCVISLLHCFFVFDLEAAMHSQSLKESKLPKDANFI
jgi:hypothetical protein